MEIIRPLKEPFPHLIIENLYDDEELELIWEELEFLNKLGKLNEPENYGAAGKINDKNEHYYSTNAKGLNLENVYNDRNISNILRVNKKLFKYAQTYSNLSPHHLKFLKANFSITKIRYYENGGSYLPHTDYFFDTLACTYFYKQPKKFSGGELFFPQFDNYEIPCIDNCCIIFPSCFVHGVKKIHLENNDCNSKYGRYCMSQFTNAILND